MSMPPSGQKTVRPVSVSPLMIGQLMALRPRCRGSSDGWYWMVPCVGTARNSGRHDQRDEGHHLEVGRERAELLHHRRVAERRRADERQPGGRGRLRERVLPLPRGRGVDGDDLVAAAEQRLEHGLAEGLLAVNHDAHRSLL